MYVFTFEAISRSALVESLAEARTRGWVTRSKSTNASRKKIVRDTIVSITASPITNHVCKFYEKLEGDFNDTYSFSHSVLPDNVRNYCVMDVEFEQGGSSCSKLKIEMERIPTTGAISDD